MTGSVQFFWIRFKSMQNSGLDNLLHIIFHLRIFFIFLFNFLCILNFALVFTSINNVRLEIYWQNPTTYSFETCLLWYFVYNKNVWHFFPDCLSIFSPLRKTRNLKDEKILKLFRSIRKRLFVMNVTIWLM